MKSFRLGSLILLAFINVIGIAMPYPILTPLVLKGELPTLFELTPLMTVMTLLGLYPLGQFIGSPLFGAYSDKKGSKQVLICSLTLSTLGYLLSAFAIGERNIQLFALSRLLTGLSEGNFSVIRAEVGKLVSGEKERLRLFGILNSSAGAAWLTGPLLGGFMSEPTYGFSPSSPFYFAAALALGGILLCYFILEKREPSQRGSNQSLITLIKNVWSLPGLPFLLILSFFISMSVDGFYEIFPSYLVTQYEASPSFLGKKNVILTLSMILTQTFLVPRLQFNYLSFFLPGGAFALALLLMVSGKSELYLTLSFLGAGLGIGSLMTLSTGSVSKHVPKKQLGSVMGNMDSLRNLGDVLVCISFGLLGEKNISSCLLFLSTAILITSHFYGMRIKKLEKPHHPSFVQ